MHPTLPQTMTPENLAEWIKENRVDTTTNKVTEVISREERADLEHVSSSCSQKLDELEEIKKQFNDFINNGTYDPSLDEEKGAHVTIPSTVGIKKLTEERKATDKLLREGHRVISTILYYIPWPEEKRMIAFDIEGQEFEEFSRNMREDEINKYRTMFETAPIGEVAEVADPLMEVSEGGGDGPTEDVVLEDNVIVDNDPLGLDLPEAPKGRKKRGASQEPII